MGDTMYPILTLNRAVTLTDKQIQSIFGGLMMIQNHQTMYRVILIFLTIFMIGIGIVFFVLMKKKINADENKGGKVIVVNQDDHYMDIDQV